MKVDDGGNGGRLCSPSCQRTMSIVVVKTGIHARGRREWEKKAKMEATHDGWVAPMPAMPGIQANGDRPNLMVEDHKIVRSYVSTRNFDYCGYHCSVTLFS